MYGEKPDRTGRSAVVISFTVTTRRVDVSEGKLKVTLCHIVPWVRIFGKGGFFGCVLIVDSKRGLLSYRLRGGLTDETLKNIILHFVREFSRK